MGGLRRSRRDRGATMVEYGMVAAFIAAVAAFAVTNFGTAVSSLFVGPLAGL